MKVHNFQIEKRMELFNRWVKKRGERDNNFTKYFYDGGNDIYITPISITRSGLYHPRMEYDYPFKVKKVI